MSPSGSERRHNSSRLKIPSVGLTIGIGLLIGESLAQVRLFLDSFGAVGIWEEMLVSLAVYVIGCAALDLLVQAAMLAGPAGLRASRVARAVPILAVAFVVHKAFGLTELMAYGSVPIAAVWALSAHVRWSVPLAVGLALFAFQPALPQATDENPISSAARSSSTSVEGPSIVIVVMDTMRRDHVSAYGYHRDTTPNLRALAERGTRFEQAYSTSCWTIPSHASLFTGLMPSGHKATFEHFRMEDGFETLASVLSARGYETVGLSGNPYVSRGTGLARGFETFHEVWRPHVMRRLLVPIYLWNRLGGGAQDKGGADIVAAVEEWKRERDPSRPYLLFVNLMEAHSPYQDAQLKTAFTDPALSGADLERIGDESHQAQWLGTKVAPGSLPATIDLLDGAIASADEYLGRVVEIAGDGAIVVAASDHGDLVGEHGLYGHMTGLYQPLIRVPLVMAGPGVPRGAVVDAPVSLVDVMPTVLGLAGAEPPPGDGIDLRPVFAAGSDEAIAERILTAEHYGGAPATNLWGRVRSPEEMRSIQARRRAAVTARLKRVVAGDGTDFGYDLLADPDETNPMPGDATALAVSVPGPIEPAGGANDPVELDPAQIEALKSLGYVH